MRPDCCRPPLAPIAYPRMNVWANRLGRRPVRLAMEILALACVLSATYVMCSDDTDCEHAVRANNINLALLVCHDEYLATNDPQTGARLANVQRRSGDLPTARALATNLLATTARSDALQILG